MSKNVVTLKSRSLKMIPIGTIYWVLFPISVLYCNFALKRIVFEVIDFKNAVTLKTG